MRWVYEEEGDMDFLEYDGGVGGDAKLMSEVCLRSGFWNSGYSDT